MLGLKPFWRELLFGKRGGGGDINVPETPPVPGPGPQEQELQDLQLQFFKEQAPMQRQLQQQQLEFFAGTLPAAQEAQLAQTQLLQSLIGPAGRLGAQREQVISPLLRGEAAPGMFGALGTPFEEGPAFERGRERILSSLSEAGLLDSGIRAELETQLSGDIAAQTEQARRGELANLLNIGLGGAGGAIGEVSALGGAPIQTALGGGGAVSTGLQAGGQALTGQQTTAQRVASFNQQIFQSQLEAAAQERAARMAMFGQLGAGLGQAVGGAAGASSKRYKKNVKLWAKPYNLSLN